MHFVQLQLLKWKFVRMCKSIFIKMYIIENVNFKFITFLFSDYNTDSNHYEGLQSKISDGMV